MTILDISQNVGINDPIRTKPIFGHDVELTRGNTISGSVDLITKKQKEEGINTLRDLGNEYGTLTQADKNRLNTIFNSKQPLSKSDKDFLEKEADELYKKIPQVANNKARTLLTDGVSNNYNGTYSDAFNDLNKLLSKVDNVFNTDKNDVVADAGKALKSLEDGINSNSLIAGPFIVNGKINEDSRQLQDDRHYSSDVQGTIDYIQKMRKLDIQQMRELDIQQMWKLDEKMHQGLVSGSKPAARAAAG